MSKRAPKMTVNPDGSVSVRHHRRRMNIANGKALSRATRRLHAFAKRYRKIVGFVSPRKPKGHMYFKKKRKTA
jgi:hypothetical protein